VTDAEVFRRWEGRGWRSESSLGRLVRQGRTTTLEWEGIEGRRGCGGGVCMVVQKWCGWDTTDGEVEQYSARPFRAERYGQPGK